MNRICFIAAVEIHLEIKTMGDNNKIYDFFNFMNESFVNEYCEINMPKSVENENLQNNELDFSQILLSMLLLDDNMREKAIKKYEESKGDQSANN